LDTILTLVHHEVNVRAARREGMEGAPNIPCTRRARSGPISDWQLPAPATRKTGRLRAGGTRVRIQCFVSSIVLHF
jgi:hypothetical protein